MLLKYRNRFEPRIIQEFHGWLRIGSSTEANVLKVNPVCRALSRSKKSGNQEFFSQKSGGYQEFFSIESNDFIQNYK